MRGSIGVEKQLLIGLCLTLPVLSAIGGHRLDRGLADVLAVPALAVQRAVPVGGDAAKAGLPCRRSARMPGDDVPKSATATPNAGCKLRLVKRRPADALTWV